MKFGIDFGTTNSAIAYFDGETLQLVTSDPANVNNHILPSLIYFNKDGSTSVGASAATDYLGNESQREVRWKSKVMGEVQITVAGRGGSLIQYWQTLSILIDEAATGRLFQSAKTYLRDMVIEGTQVFDQYFTVDQLLAALLINLKQRTEAQFSQPCTDVVIGRPVAFSHDPEIDAYAEEILYKAAHLAGFNQISFALEPIGAVFLYHTRMTSRTKVLVFDFGGGTLDLTVAEVGGDERPRILATRGVLLGGDDLDRKIMQMLLKYFAADEKKNKVIIPYDMISQLQSWQTMPELSKPHFQEEIRNLLNRAEQLGDRETLKQLEALNTLVKSALGYSLFQKIEENKKRLSDFIFAPIMFEHGKLKINETIRRELFESRMRKEIADVRLAVEDVVREAGLDSAEIESVVRTGGTSQVPMFIDLLADLFGADKLRDMDPLASVVGGLAIMAHEDEGRVPAYAAKYIADPNTLIRDISTASGNRVEAFTLQAGANWYCDAAAVRIEKLSIQLSALPAIRNAAADVHHMDEHFLKFNLTSAAKIYVAYSDHADLIPAWLKAFSPSPYFIEIKDDFDRMTRMPAYVKAFKAGEVVLGGNKASGIEDVYHHYLVIVEKSL